MVVFKGFLRVVIDPNLDAGIPVTYPSIRVKLWEKNMDLNVVLILS